MNEGINKKTVGKGVFNLYLEAISTMFSGFLFWVILSKITSPDVIGISSTIISFITIFSFISVIGMQGGIQRYLVRCITDKKTDEIKDIINSALLIISLGIAGSCIFLFVSKDWVFSSLNLDLPLFLVMILTIALMTLTALLRAINMAAMQTKSITVSSILSTIIKLSVALILVMMGLQVYGILVGYMLSPVVTCVLLYATIKRKILNQKDKTSQEKKSVGSFKFLREIFVAGTSFWIPGSINTIGSQLGTVLVYLAESASHAGIYFLSFSIVTGITMMNSVLSTIAYPAISSMKDGRKTAVWRFMKLSLVLTLPLSFAIIFYSKDVLLLFGSGYAEGNSYLQILLLSILPTTIISGTGVLAYAYGNNRQVLYMGLFTSIPRILLYFLFVPIFGGNGAAFIYLLGSIIGCIVSIIVAKKIGLIIFWKQIALVSIIPLLLLILVKYSSINFLLGTLVTLVATYVLYSLLRVIDNEDIEDILKILPSNLANLLNDLMFKISKKIHNR